MPRQSPNLGSSYRLLNNSMSLFYCVKMTKSDMPEMYITLVWSTGENIFTLRMPCSSCHWIGFPLESAQFLHYSDIMDLQRTILWPSQQPITIDRVPSDWNDSLIMRLYTLNCFSTSRVPKLYIVVLTPSCNDTFSWMPMAGLNIRTMSWERQFFLGSKKIENLGGTVCWASQKLQCTRSEWKISNFFGMCFQVHFLIHLWVRVNDFALVISRDDVLLILGPLESLNLGLLMNCICTMIKVDTIPNRDFSIARSCEQAFSIFHPSHWIQRMFQFTFCLLINIRNKLRAYFLPWFFVGI